MLADEKGMVMESKATRQWTRANGVTFLGGVMGLFIFLVVGLLPSLLYGGYAGVILGAAIFGAPIHESVLAQATVVLGVLSGVLSIGGIFVLGGAILATGIHGTAQALRRAAPGQAEPSKVEVSS